MPITIHKAPIGICCICESLLPRDQHCLSATCKGSHKCCDKCLSSEDYEPLYTYAPVAPALVEKTGPRAFVIERGVEEGLKGEGVVKQAKRQDGGCCVVM
jgi:hypothetical protein